MVHVAIMMMFDGLCQYKKMRVINNERETRKFNAPEAGAYASESAGKQGGPGVEGVWRIWVLVERARAATY